MKIKDIKIYQILDSRKEKTFKIEMFSEKFSVFSSVGKGKSRGSQEVELVSFERAKKLLCEIKELLISKDFLNLKEFEEFLLKLDNTKNKSRLGGNLILALSIAFIKLLAKERGLFLFQLLREEFLSLFPKFKSEFKNYQIPYFLFNFLNGGKHAPSGPDFQEYLFIPLFSDPDFSLNLAKIFFLGLKEWFKKNDIRLNYGDEGGLIYPEKDNEKPLEIFYEVIKDLNLSNRFEIKLGIDAAFSSISKGKNFDVNFYEKLIKKYNLFYVEDPFSENDFSSFSLLRSKIGDQALIVGDDLTVTNPSFIEKAINLKAINSVIIKPTQIGSLTETFKAVAVALSGGLKTIISHRSGETEDDFLADLAVAINAFGLKSGSFTQKERLVKYLRVQEIYKFLKYEKSCLC